jgi:hypothetical protein
MKNAGLVVLMLATLASGCATRPPVMTQPTTMEIAYISEIVRHLYRWHMDETMLGNVDDNGTLEVWGRRLHPPLDAGDRSEFYEVLIPDLLYRMQMKKADYTISELGLHVTNHNFKIVSAERLEARPALPADAEQVLFPQQQILDYLFRTRNEKTYPSEALLDRMEAAVTAELPTVVSNSFATAQTIYLAPISPVGNDLWLFWETQRMLIKFSSDADLQSETYWSNKKLGVRFYDLDKNVVVSLSEVAGSNAFVTRDWAARVLFNCLVHGKKMVLEPLPVKPDAPKPRHVAPPGP